MITENTGGLPRYCHPYHGGWDVARIALDIPESRILFVCPVSCARIICLNAVKYHYKDRIDVLALTEDDIVSGNYEEKTIEAACEIMDTVLPKPKALILYVSCIDAMLGNDHSFQTDEIMARYPGLNCFVLKMCPITRFSGDNPMVALNKDMMLPLPEQPVEKEKIVAFLGSNIAYDPQCELVKLLADNGYRPLHIQESADYEDYLKIRASSLNLCLMPFASSAGRLLAQRYGTPMLPYFARYDFASIRKTLTDVCLALSIPLPDLDRMEAETRQALAYCAGQIGDTGLIIDSTATLFPDALRETLVSCGFRVTKVYADDVARQEPDTDSGSILRAKDRSYMAGQDAVGIGMVSSSFGGTRYTVDMFYDNGEWGFYGLKKLAQRILEAYRCPESAGRLRSRQRQAADLPRKSPDDLQDVSKEVCR